MSTIVPGNIKRQVGLLMRKKTFTGFFVGIFWNHISKEVNDNSYTFFFTIVTFIKNWQF